LASSKNKDEDSSFLNHFTIAEYLLTIHKHYEIIKINRKNIDDFQKEDNRLKTSRDL